MLHIPGSIELKNLWNVWLDKVLQAESHSLLHGSTEHIITISGRFANSFAEE